MARDFNALMQGFGVVTVMNATIYKPKSGVRYVGKAACAHAATDSNTNYGKDGALIPNSFYCTGLYLDTLKIANFTQEGPTKTVTGGQYANPLIKYGKTMTCEMQDALGRAATMVEFFGCEYVDNRLSVTDKFPGAFAIEGETFFIDQKTGEKEIVYIFIPQFTPDAILTLTQDAEGDATVFDLNGTISVTKIADTAQGETRDIFYEIRNRSFFADAGGEQPDSAGKVGDKVVVEEGDHNWHESTTVHHKVTLVTDDGISTIAVEDKTVPTLPTGYTWKRIDGTAVETITADVTLVGTKVTT